MCGRWTERTNPAEAPVALYTYDSDLSLKWPKKSGKKLTKAPLVCPQDTVGEHCASSQA